jgi:hypothetical protein
MPEAISTAEGCGRTLPGGSLTRPIVEGNEQRWLFCGTSLEIVSWRCLTKSRQLTPERQLPWNEVTFAHTGCFRLHAGDRTHLIDGASVALLHAGIPFRTSQAEAKDPADAIMDLVVADQARTTNINFIMDERDVRAALASPLVSLGTDAAGMAEDGIFSQERSHPRAWASTARILGHYVRDEKLLTLEEAVRGQRPAGGRRRQDHRRTSRPAAPGARLRATALRPAPDSRSRRAWVPH